MKYKNVHKPISLENPNVQKVIEIAKDLISQNKVIKVKKLYNIAVRSLEISGKNVSEIIQYLTNNNILIDGTKHTRDSILLNFYRKKIYDVIDNKNGATFSFLREHVFSPHSGSSGQLIWHLNMLLKFKYIKKVKLGKFSLFLPIDLQDDIGILYFFMKDNLNRSIITLLMNNEKIEKSEIYKKIGFKRENVNYHLNVLIKHNILTYKNESTKEIGLSETMKKILLEYIKQKL